MRGPIWLVAGASAGVAVVAAGCGGSGDKTDTVTAPAATTPPASTAASSPPATTTAAASSPGANPLTGVAPPAGSSKLASRSSGATTWTRYSTRATPKSVVSSYRASLTSAGWAVVQAAGGGGGWGPYGGSGGGLTAKKSGAYADVQAGAARSSKTYFETCAGDGARGLCDRMSTKADSSSSGSHPGGDDAGTSSGAS